MKNAGARSPAIKQPREFRGKPAKKDIMKMLHQSLELSSKCKTQKFRSP